MCHQLQAIWLCGFIPSFIPKWGKRTKRHRFKAHFIKHCLDHNDPKCSGPPSKHVCSVKDGVCQISKCAPCVVDYGIFSLLFFFKSQKLLLRVLLQCDAVKTMTHYAYAIPTLCFIIYRRGMPIHCSLLLNVHESQWTAANPETIRKFSICIYRATVLRNHTYTCSYISVSKSLLNTFKIWTT